jgi:hypothetical protein
MSISPFASDRKLVDFAGLFLANRVETFRKDIAICLTADESRQHAYFPGLITCIAFADLLSGLYAGKLDHHGLPELTKYATKFMNRAHYDAPRLEILREAFRHKLAHLAYPYVVFDTGTKPGRFVGQPRRRITWTVYANNRTLPIEVVDFSTPQSFSRTPTPWPVSYDCRVKISVRRLQVDIVKSIYGRSGYLRNLQLDRQARERFAQCMILYFPP